MNPLQERLSKICLENPSQLKYLLSDDYIAAYELLQSLAHKQGWAHIKAVSSLELAQDVLVRCGIFSELLLEDSKQLLIDQLIRQGVDQNQLPYLQRLQHPCGLVPDIAAFFSLLRRIGQSPEALLVETFVSPEKGRDMKWLYQAYVQKLKDLETTNASRILIDRDQMFEQALRLVKSRAVQSQGLILVLEENQLSQTERKFIHAYAGEKRMSLGLGAGNPERPSLPTEWVFRQSYSPLSEVWDMYRECLSRCLPLEDVEVIVPDSRLYNSLLAQVAETQNIPLTFHEGLPLEHFRSGRTLLLLLQWLKSELRVQALLTLLRTGVCECPSLAHLEKMVLAQGKGARFYEQTLLYLESASDDLESLRWHKWLQSWWNNWKQCQDWSLTELVARIADWLEQIFSKEDPVCRRLRGWLQVDEVEMSLQDKVTFLLRRVELWSLEKKSARPGALHVSSIHQARYVRRKYIFYLGLNDHWLPGRMRGGALLLEQEKELLPLEATMLNPVEQLMQAARRSLEQAQGKLVILSCVQGYGLPQKQEAVPSLVMLKMFRRINKDDTLSYEQLEQALERMAGYWPQKEVVGLWRWEKKCEHLPPSLQRGLPAMKQRQNSVAGPYDGLLEGLTASLDPRQSASKSMSVTALQTLATCPYRYLLRYIIQLNEEDLDNASAMQDEQWLTVQQKGQLLHEVYFELITLVIEAHQEKQVPTLEQLRQKAQEQLDRWRAQVPSPDKAVLAKECYRINQNITAFVERELKNKTRQPFCAELAFGRSKTTKVGWLHQEQPVPVRLPKGDVLPMSGSIDRIDYIPEQGYVVLDYKTGRGSWIKREDVLRHGQLLQPALYALILEQLLKEQQGKVLLSGYYYATVEGEFKQQFVSRPERDVLGALLEHLLDMIKQGHFVRPPECDSYSGPCTHCAYQSVCHVYRSKDLTQKWDNEENNAYESWRKLSQKEYR